MRRRLEPLQPKVAPIREGYALADYTRAKEHMFSQSYMHKNPDGSFQKLELFASNDGLKHFGLGVYLYLEFLRRLFVLFLILSAISALALTTCYSGTGLSQYPSSFTVTLAQFSIGNLSNAGTQKYLIITITDLLCTCFFLVFWFHWKRFHTETVLSTDEDPQFLNPATYALEVTNLPANLPRLELEKQIKTHIEQIVQGPVYEVEVVYDYQGDFAACLELEARMDRVEKETQVTFQTSKNTSSLELMKEELREHETALSKISHSFVPLYAVVLFEKLSSKAFFLQQCKKFHLFKTVGDAFLRGTCCVDDPPALFHLAGKPLLVQEVFLARPEQRDWRNEEISWCGRLTRWLVSILLVVLVVIVTSAIIVLGTLYVATTSSCQFYSSATLLAQASAAGGKTLFCYCATHLSDLLLNAATQAACASLTNTIIVTNVLQVVASVVSSVTNMLLALSVTVIAKHVLRPATVPQSHIFLMTWVLIASIINSVAMPLALNGNIFGLVTSTYLRFLSFIDFSQLSVFSDFTADWFATISPYYLNLIIVNVVLLPIELAVAGLLYCLRHTRLRSACDQPDSSDPIIQKEANERLLSPFNLPIETSALILSLFIVLTYSGLLPLMYPVYALVLGLMYVVKKLQILYLNTRIPADETLNTKLLQVLPFMALLHVLFSLWSHTTPSRFAAGASPFSFSVPYFSSGIDRIFVDGLECCQLGLIAVALLGNYTIGSLVVCLQESCKDELELPASQLAIQHERYSQRVSKLNIDVSYKLVNSSQYGHAMRAFLRLLEKSSRKDFEASERLNPEEGS